MTNEIKFADTVILVDVAYVDRVAGDLSKHFGDVVNMTCRKQISVAMYVTEHANIIWGAAVSVYL